jgi:5-methylcytosine-specific restriction endonuclease McrA
MCGLATCPACRREKYLVVKRRYQQSAKGIATARARDSREDVREKRRRFSRSQYGKRNKAKYEATPKGRLTRAKAISKYRASGHEKQASARRHQLTRANPTRKAQRRKANVAYRQTAKGKAMKHRQGAKRRGAILTSEKPLTAEEWSEVLAAHKFRCFYCKRKKKLTLDHVIPLSKGGQHTKMNVVPACGPCNSRKCDRIVTLF